MRVLVITNMYPPHHYGGYELNCQEFASALRAAGHEVLVLTSDIEVPGVTAAPEDRSETRRELRLYWREHVVLRPSPRESLAIERANERALADAIEDHRPDVVSAWHMGAVSLGLLAECRSAGLPLVHVINDDWLVYAPRMDRWAWWWRRAGPIARMGERLLGVRCRVPDLGRLGTFCFITETTKRAAERYGWTFTDATVSYCGINTDDFPIGAEPARRSWSWRLLHVGRIDDRKGIDTAIRALALLPDAATLDVIGRGDDTYLDELRALARDVGVADRVRFAVAERHELRAMYGAADALLFMPRWAEPFGLVPIEAMACATPVIATGTGGSAEFLIDGANCILSPPEDAEALAAALERLAGDAALRSRLVAGGLETAAELTLDRWLAVLERWHAAAATGAAPPPHRRAVRDVLAERIAAAQA